MHNLHRIACLRLAKNRMIRQCQDIAGLMIGCPPDHHPIQSGFQKVLRLLKRGDSPIHREMQRRKQPLHLHHKVIIKGGNITIFLGAETIKPGFARVHRKPRNASR